ncbi:MAG TPA: hypothetical protein VF416_10805 [Marmoricola sp.]
MDEQAELRKIRAHLEDALQALTALQKLARFKPVVEELGDDGD